MKEKNTMKRLFFIATVLLSALLFGSATDTFAQAISYSVVEEKPVFQASDTAETDFAKWVAAHIQYPATAKENGIQGRVTVRFTIDTDGTVKNAMVLRGIDPALDKEALRVISSSPKWKSGRHNGQPVAVTYVFPVIFKL